MQVMDDDRWPFTTPVETNGYRWWYIDAIAEDGLHALTAIVFIGSVFSPWYFRSRRRGPSSANEHSAINLALYGPCRRWCMTERPAATVCTSERALRIGPSRLCIDGRQLTLDIVERAVPWPYRLKGQLSIDLPDTLGHTVALDEAAAHHWRAIAPSTHIRVSFEQPSLSWSGRAYLDSNWGRSPLEQSFRRWHWSRRHAANGSTLIRYDVEERNGTARARDFIVEANSLTERPPAPQDTTRRLPPTRWFRMPRTTRVARGDRIEQLQTLEDTPFYTRSRYREIDASGSHQVMHESLDLDRFSNPLVQCMLPFRAPRNPGRGRT